MSRPADEPPDRLATAALDDALRRGEVRLGELLRDLQALTTAGRDEAEVRRAIAAEEARLAPLYELWEARGGGL